MAHVYVYSWDNADFSTIGECGALDAFSCTFEEVGNGMSEIAMIHPIDRLGKHTFLIAGSVLKANVPVRTTPEIENGAFVTQVESWKVKQTATKLQRHVYTKQEGGRRTKTLNLGAEVIVTSKPAESERWKIKSGKVSGWIASAGLERSVEIIVPGTAAGIENAAPAWESREQLFRIYKVEKADDGIYCSARHIQYDLLQNMTTFDKNGAVTLQESGDAILENCIDPHDFRFYTHIAGTQAGAHYVDTDPISAFLNPENGLATAWSAQQVRDNYDIFMLANAGMDRGTRIEFARNMLGVQMDESIEETATAIRPIGKKKDGSPLYLDGSGIVISPYADRYPFWRICKLECTDCTVGTNDVTEEIAKARMLEQAEALFAKGVDLPRVSVHVTFASLGHTQRYAQYRNLENVFLYDAVAVINPRLNINVKTQVIRVMWDCLREKMLSVELGSLQALSPSVEGWQISGGISGGKLVYGSVGSSQLGNDIISARHLQAESINTEALQAEAVTAEKIAAGAITADKLQADIVDAVSIEAITAHIESLTAQSITTDRLAAALAAFTVITAGTAEFDRATIQHLVANALNLSFGVGDEVFIKNLKVIYAQMVSAAIGNLVIKASNGNYYEIDVDADGNVSATLSTVTDGEISAGQTDAGKVILGTEITAESLNTSNLLATYALVNQIDASRIDVDTLWAREAFIAHLNTADISSNGTITIIAGKVEDAQSTAKTANNNANTAISRSSTALSSATYANNNANTALNRANDASEKADTALSSVNTAVTSVDVEYYLSESATELIGGEWDSVAPEWVNGKYMWSRTVTTLKNGTARTSDPTCIAGARGPQGTPGVGVDGKTSYFHVKYAPVENPTVDQMTETPDIYIGTYVDFTSADSNDPSDYTWARFQGLQGEQGIPGVGVDGKTSYLHIKYSDDGGASFTANNGETVGEYIGQYVDYTEADSTDPSDYKWAKIKGEQGAEGIGIADITEYYARSSSGTIEPTEWQPTPPTLTSTYRYLWNYEVITYTDLVTTKETAKRVIGVYGNTGNPGAAGNGIADITNYYLATAAGSGVTTSTSGWTTAIQTTTDTKKYLWNYEVITYTNGGTNTSDPVIIGTHGEDGRGVAAIYEQYYLSTSSTTQTGGEWTNTMPEWESGKYIWTRSEIIYTDGEFAYTDPYYDHSLTMAGEAQTAASNAGAIAASAVEALGEIPNYVEIQSDGLYLKDENGASTLKLNSGSVSIGTVAGTAADGFSQFTASYVQFGNYQLRRTADGGLAFKMR